jgi:hypothetical protein
MAAAEAAAERQPHDQFTGSYPALNFSVSVTYRLTVN